MKTKIKIIILLFLITFLFGCDLCDNKIITESTNNNIKAVLFERGCGETTATSYQVSLLKNGKRFTDNITGNVFRATGIKDVSIEWEDEGLLIITFSVFASPKIFLEEEQLKINGRVMNINYKSDVEKTIE
ncbi:MAG: hypothetical protein ACTHW2_07220 [Tissierella sp.]|uniref:hypothetical protein n=1 Tax=Tissierella sp. TaxID=41274 RepID=UPI003F9D665E